MAADNDEPTRPAAGTLSTDDDRRDARWVGAGLLAMVVALIVALIVISGAANPDVELTLFGGTITHDQVLLLGVLTAGALGGCIHVATSFSDYVGNNQYKATWQYWYLIRPFIGAALASAFYFLLRGGLLSLASTDGGNLKQSPSFYGVTAIAFLVGMFSKQATDKLDDVFDTLFKSNKDADRKNGLNASTPVLTRLIPDFAVPAAAEQVVELQGTGFEVGAQVQVDGNARAATGAVSATSIKVTLTADEMKQPHEFKLAVVNADGGTSKELVFSVAERRQQPGSPDDRGGNAGADQQQVGTGVQGQTDPAAGQQTTSAGNQQTDSAAGKQADPAASQQGDPAANQQGDATVGAADGASINQGHVGLGMGVDGENPDGTSG